MKKYFKTYTKKSLALLMTVMMLMSCWVFVAPEHNHASAVSASTIASTNNSAISGLDLSTAVTTIYGSFGSDSDYLESKYYDVVYHNVLYTDGTVSSATATSDKTEYGSETKLWVSSNGVTVYWYHPQATLMYDGDTSDLPRLGVALNTVMYYTGTWSRKTVNRLSWVSSGGNGFEFNQNWKGTDGRLNFQYMWNGQEELMGYTSTIVNDSMRKTLESDSDDHFFANLLKFTGSMSNTEYVRTITPTFSFYGDNGTTAKTISATSTKSITIINYVPLKNALNDANAKLTEIKNNPSKYSTASVAKFAELAKALVAAKPNNYVNSSKNDYTGYASAAKAAVDAYNAWSGLELATYTVTFKASNSLFTETKSTTYGGSVSYICENVVGDKTGHYTFQCWHEGDVNAHLGTSTTITINNVTDDRTITAQYSSSESHNKAGEVIKIDDTHHAYKCSVCGYQNDSESCSFGDWTTSGNNHVRSCACGNKQTHTPNWVDKAETKYLKSNATCTEPATYYKSCSTCGMQGTETFTSGSASGHYYELDETLSTPGTCEKDGIAVYKCATCGHKLEGSIYKRDYKGNIIEGEYYDKGGHNLVFSESVDHTCITPGYFNYYCLRCEKYFPNYEEANDPAEHTWETTKSKYSETQHGIKCKLCVEWKDGSLENHDWKLTKTTKEQTCKTDGEGVYTCTGCGATKTDVIKADGKSHVLGNATSNNDGTHSAKCTVNGCNYEEDKVNCTNNGHCVCLVCGGSLAHDFTKQDAKDDALKSAATCEDSAVYYYSCSVCGKVNNVEDAATFKSGEALGHDWRDAEEVLKSAATCEDNEVYYQKCSRCEKSSKDIDDTKVYEKPNSALGHNFEATADNAVDNKDGTHSYKCKNGCSATGVGKVKDERENCTYGESYTINNDGTHTQTCTVCRHNKTEEHNYSAWSHIENKTADGKHQHQKKCVCGDIVTEACDMQETKTPATCLSVGKIGTKCSKCYFEETQDDPNAPQLNHSYTGDYVYDAKTDTHKRYCVNGCNELDPTATACTYEYAHVDGTNTHKATCKDCKGEKTLDCHGGSATCIQKAVCDDCKAEYGDFAPHTFEGDAVNAGDGKHNYKCTTEGCTTVGVGTEVNATESCSGGIAYCDEKATCDKCHEKYGEVNKNNHKETNREEMPGLAPTCMQPGYTNYQKCKSCGAELNKTTLGIDSTKHSFDGEAVSNSDGTHIVHCSNMNAEGTAQCSATKTVTCHCSEPTVTSPSCLDGGYQSNKCDDCGYEWTSDETQPLGHDWGQWTYNEATGKHEKVCKRDGTHTESGECKDSQTETIVNPTCTEQGYTLHTCTLCAHEWKTDYVDALGHDYSQKIPDAEHEYTDKPKSCTNAQYYWFDCSRCDKNAKNEEDHVKYPLNSLYYENGDGKGHVWEGKDYKSEHAIIKTAATCTENAVYYVYCTACGASTKGLDDAATFVASGTAISHNYVTYNPAEKPAEGETAKKVYPASEATCTAKATYYKRCANCGAKGKETFEYGEKLQHTFTEQLSDTAHRITRATCSTKATYWYDCATCELSAEFADKTGMTEDQIAALKYADGDFDKNNHTAKNDVPVKNPTCLDDGHSAYEHCDACGADIGKVTKGYEKIAHSYTGAYVAVNETAADGTVTYMHKRACVYGCGNYSEVTACSFGDFSQDAEKTDGKFTHSKSCACGNKITQDCTSDATASCTQAVTCTVCHGTMQAAGGHKWSAWTSSGDGKTHYRVCENDPSHKETEACHGGTADGCGAIYCEVCSQAYAKGDNHSWGTWYEKTPATCTADQVKERECSSCHITETEVGDKATGHKYDRVEETTPATCTKDGVMTYYCVNGTCKDSYTKPINKLGHELGEWITTTESTCKDEGVQTRYCKHSWKTTDGNEVKCDYFETQPIAADPSKHVPGEWQVVSGSGDCTSGIKYAKYCTKCNEVVDEKTEIIPHKWEADKVYNATCLENGYIEVKCLNCNATEVFDENTQGWPYKIDETTINPNDVLGLVAKGSHTWRTEAADGDTNYTVVDGCIVYITSPFSCADSGRGNRYCEVCSATESIVIPASGHDLKTIPGSPASCTVPGYQEYKACKNCPYQETPVKIPALGHEDTNGDGKCDRCYFKMYEDSSGNTSACGCICHSNSFFISKIIYPIARFFWKLFKINHDCSCGKTHY